MSAPCHGLHLFLVAPPLDMTIVRPTVESLWNSILLHNKFNESLLVCPPSSVAPGASPHAQSVI